MQTTVPIIQEIGVFCREIMTTKPEHGLWSLAWSLESFLAWEGDSYEVLPDHIIINFIFSWKRLFLPFMVKILITISKLKFLLSRMVTWVDAVIKLILLSKLDHKGTMSRHASCYTYIRWSHDVMVLFSVCVYVFSSPALMF